MNNRIIKGILLTISLSLAILMVIFHYWIIKVPVLFQNSSQGIPPILYQGAFASFLLATSLYIRQVFSRIDRLDVITMLWRLFIIGMVGISLMLVMLMVKRIVMQNFNASSAGLLTPVFFTGGIVALLVYFLSAVFIFKRFILYQKTRRKLISWNIFLGFLIIALFLTLQDLYSSPIPEVQDTVEIIELVITTLYGILLLYLSTNVSWTAYLNFNQKLKALGLFGLTIIVSITYLMALSQLPEELVISSPARNFLNGHLELKFINYIASFTIAYSAFSILVLFFNLPTSSVFELKSSEIASFNKINQAIKGKLDLDQILNTLLDASMLSANASAGWVLVEMENESDPKDKESLKTFTFQLHNRKGVGGDEMKPFNTNRALIEKVSKDKHYYLVKNLRRHKAFQGLETRFKSLVVFPIMVRDEVFGLLFVANEISNSFEDVTLGSLNSFSEQAGSAIENTKLINNAIALERYEEQLKIAKEVQNQLLPKALPKSDRVSFDVFNETADEVGGDYYDIIQEGEDGFRIAIGDVSGKGTTAAFYMAEVKGVFHALSQTGVDPTTFVLHANEALSACFQKGFFLTLTYLFLDLNKKEIQLIRAGHCPTFFYSRRKDEALMLREGTLGLGIVRNQLFQNHLKCAQSLPFESGDFMVLYTDGIPEARNQEGEEFGYERMQQVIENHKNDNSEEMGKRLLEGVKDFAGDEIHDDYTILIIRFL